MSFSIGLDIGGTKLAAAVFNDDREEVTQIIVPTPDNYSDFVTTCVRIVRELEGTSRRGASVGIGLPGAVDQKAGGVTVASNIAYLGGKPLRADLEKNLGRSVRLANDASCAALSEAIDGAGKGYENVFGLIMGTGVGGGLALSGKIIEGANGAAGEIGHLPLPFRETSDGPVEECLCGQKGCIEKAISGPALARLYSVITSRKVEALQIAEHASRGDADALKVLDQFYTVVAKAMASIIHMLDPDIIVVSGGLSALPGFYDEVPKRWDRYTLCKNLKTKLVPARHGAMTGLRGAAWLGLQAI